VTVKRNRFLLLASGLAMVLAMAFVAAAEQLAQAAPQEPVFNPNNFVSKVDNQFFPLIPGTTFRYRGTSDGVPTRNVTFVTHDTKRILGVTTTVVRDRAFEDGVLVEDTFDWFAQDKAGNVWYFGEDSKELDPQGNVISTEGSWKAGVNGAEPGIIMEADPQVGDRYEQEEAPGVAEDQARVLSLTASACVPYKPASNPNGCFKNLLQTKEWTQLEPGVVEHKYYAKGVGFILGVMVKGGEERTELVSVTTTGG
jgi:hypothetical protein